MFSTVVKVRTTLQDSIILSGSEKVNFIVNTHAKTLGAVVETLDSALHRHSIRETNCTFHWIEIYPVVSAIQPLNN